MEIRLRSILTRIQTMKSSTLVAIAIMFGLLIVVHIKQSDYNDRVKEKRDTRAYKLADKTSAVKKSVDIDNDPKEVTTYKTIQSTTSGTEESYVIDELDDEQEVDIDYEESDDEFESNDINDAIGNGVTKESTYSIHEHGVSNVGDTEVFAIQNQIDQLDEYDHDYDNDNEGETEAADDNDYDYEEDDELVTSNEMNEEMMDTRNNDFDDNNNFNNKINEKIEDSMMQLSYHEGEMPDIENEVKLSQSSNDIEMVAPEISDNMVLTNYAQDGLQSGDLDDTKDVLLNDVDDGVPSLTTFNDEQEAQQAAAANFDTENLEIQRLVQKYPETLEDENQGKQGEMYVERLRNKLGQIGRLDIIYKNHCTKRLPRSIIIGVMKSGTEAFSTFLGIHPQIAMQFGYTAMDFFSNTELYNLGTDWYRNRMMCSTSGQVTIEKSPQYFSSMMAPERIHEMNKDMKLILLVRDPIDRAVSHFLQQQKSHPERMPAATFEECVYDRDRKQVIGTSQYIYQSTYSVILKRWLNYFPYRQILVVDGDTFRENPFRSLSKAEQFLNINYYFDESKLHYNEEKGFYCLQTNSDKSEDCLKGGKGRTHPEIEPEVEMALRQYFKPYNEEFIRLTGMRFDW